MKLKNALYMSVLVGTMVGCSTVSVTENQELVTQSPIKEVITILDQRARLNDGLCIDINNTLECELLGSVPNKTSRQMIKFNMSSEQNLTTVSISRWVVMIAPDGSESSKPLSVTNDMVDSFSEYIEKHRNKHTQ